MVDNKIWNQNERPLAVVTGCSSGIGRAVTDRLIDDGWKVIGVCRSTIDNPRDGLRVISADLSNSVDASRLAEEIININQPINALIHAAGFMKTAPLGELKTGDGEAMWQLHVRAVEIIANTLLKVMPNGARIVLLGSRVANGASTRSQYAAVKAALVGMARSWAIELAPRAITVNVVSPGATDTPFLQDPGRAQTKPKLPPIGRYVQAEEVSALVSFLVGRYGGAVTGQQIVMCGGSSL
jgi:NAD(P)-dependent dehydrogenase (short-subunit alcohol dehydrogenase family)